MRVLWIVVIFLALTGNMRIILSSGILTSLMNQS